MDDYFIPHHEIFDIANLHTGWLVSVVVWAAGYNLYPPLRHRDEAYGEMSPPKRPRIAF